MRNAHKVCFRVYPYVEEIPVYYEVIVHRNRKDLGRLSKIGVGYFRGCGEGPCVGSIVLWRNDPELLLTVIHEAYHATCSAQRMLGFPTGADGNPKKEGKIPDFEEYGARWHEKIVHGILRELKANKIPCQNRKCA